MDLLSIIPSELREVLFIELNEPEDLYQLYKSELIAEVFNNIQSWINKFINNMPMVNIELFNMPKRMTSRFVKYKMMMKAYDETYNTILELDETFYSLFAGYQGDIHFLWSPEQDEGTYLSFNISNFDFLELPSQLAEDINKQFIVSTIDDINIGKMTYNVINKIPNYLIKIKMGTATFTSSINDRTLFNYYFMTLLPSIRVLL
jgi:hypothetical protein